LPGRHGLAECSIDALEAAAGSSPVPIVVTAWAKWQTLGFKTLPFTIRRMLMATATPMIIVMSCGIFFARKRHLKCHDPGIGSDKAQLFEHQRFNKLNAR